MKICKVILQNKIIFENAQFAKSFWAKLFGLMFKKSYAGALIFENACWMHSFFMRFPFNALYLDSDYNIVEHHKDIRPWRVLPPVWRAKYVIEYAGKAHEIAGKLEFVEIEPQH